MSWVDEPVACALMPPTDEQTAGASHRARDVDTARAAWRLMNELVAAHDPTPVLRERLALGRGSGRVRALLSLSNGPLGLAELARAIRVDPPYATIIANELHARGLIYRTPDARDRRRRTIALTKDGRAAVRAAQDIIEAPPPELRELSANELRALTDLLTRLQEIAARPRAGQAHR